MNIISKLFNKVKEFLTRKRDSKVAETPVRVYSKEVKRSIDWRKANPDRARKNNLMWNKSHPDKIKEIAESFRERNRPRIRERAKELHWENNEHINKIRRERYHRNKGKSDDKD